MENERFWVSIHHHFSLAGVHRSQCESSAHAALATWTFSRKWKKGQWESGEKLINKTYHSTSVSLLLQLFRRQWCLTFSTTKPNKGTTPKLTVKPLILWPWKHMKAVIHPIPSALCVWVCRRHVWFSHGDKSLQSEDGVRRHTMDGLYELRYPYMILLHDCPTGYESVKFLLLLSWWLIFTSLGFGSNGATVWILFSSATNRRKSTWIQPHHPKDPQPCESPQCETFSKLCAFFGWWTAPSYLGFEHFALNHQRKMPLKCLQTLDMCNWKEENQVSVQVQDWDSSCLPSNFEFGLSILG